MACQKDIGQAYLKVARLLIEIFPGEIVALDSKTLDQL